MPELTIIAGCNGAGKSTFAKSFLPANETPFPVKPTKPHFLMLRFCKSKRIF